MKNRIVVESRASALTDLLVGMACVSVLSVALFSQYERAQMQATVAQVNADLAIVGAALEAYRADNPGHPFQAPPSGPPPHNYDTQSIPTILSTPVAYLATFPVDAFKVGATSSISGVPYNAANALEMTFIYRNIVQCSIPAGGYYVPEPAWTSLHNRMGDWRIASIGPSRLFPGFGGYGFYPFPSVYSTDAFYDPTNGAVSLGLIQRTALMQSSGVGDSWREY